MSEFVMVDSAVVELRVPADLMAQIDALKQTTGQTRAEVVLSLLHQALAPNPPALTQILQRLNALESTATTVSALHQQVAAMERTLARLSVVALGDRPLEVSVPPVVAIDTGSAPLEDWEAAPDDEPDEILYDFLGR